MENTNIKKLNLYAKLNDYYLTEQEDAEFMANIDMDALERGIEIAEQEIANGNGIEFKEAMAQIHNEVFGDEI